VRRWQPRRGECEREAFGVELADDIGEREGGACGHGKSRRDQTPRAVCDGQKIAVPVVAAVRIGAARSETNPGSVTVALGRAQFGAQSFF
jgi:hypothetical protein